MAAQKAGSDPVLAKKMAQIVQYIAELENFNADIEYWDILIFKLFNELIENYEPNEFTLAKYVLQKFPELANRCDYHGLPFIHYALKLKKYDLVEFFFTIPGFDIKLLNKTDENGQNLLHSAFSNRQLVLSQLLLRHAPHQLVSLNYNGKNPLINLVTNTDAISDEDVQFLNELMALAEFQSAARSARCPTTGDSILHKIVTHLDQRHFAEWIKIKILQLFPELITVKNNQNQLPFNILFNDETMSNRNNKFNILLMDIIPPLTLVPDQRDNSGYYPIHYLASFLGFVNLKKCVPTYSDRLVFEKTEDFLFSVYTYLLRKDRNLKLSVVTTLTLLQELDLRTNCIIR